MEIKKIVRPLIFSETARMIYSFSGGRTRFDWLFGGTGERRFTATGWLSFLPIAPPCSYGCARENHRREEPRMEYDKFALCRIVPVHLFPDYHSTQGRKVKFD